MSKEREKHIEAIYHLALEKKSGKERSDYLNSACADDNDLRVSVESLLKAHDKAGDFLESPILDSGVTLDESPISEGPGTVIGRYKLLERIGEGGMAVVYMAEQQEPIRRKVALKIIKLGMDTKSVIARFEAERQVLAMMDHPNIAKVLDAGATETGRPYFVMELVTGVSITEYCDKNNLSTKERLSLFIQVCNAVQHAHQKGIIHRDIKPTNVMVTRHEGKPVPKVIDFGIAKAINQKLTEKTLFTRYAHIIGTPAYMSPEQADLGDMDVDTRSDIYSLGVLLYELLTGTTPFSEEELRNAGYIEMQRVIREQEPPKPSTKLSTLGQTLTDIAKYRGATPDVLRKTVRGDLDWIVMKSLEKDRVRRYDTVSALAQDVQRHMSHEPVQARPPSLTYHALKFLRKHRTMLSLTSSILVAITLSLVLTAMYISVERQRRQFRDEHLLSSAQALHAKGRRQEALRQVETILESKTLGREAKLLRARLLFEAGLLDDAAAQLEQLLTESSEISGAAHLLLSTVYIGMDPVKAKQHQQRAESLHPRTAEAYCLRALTASTPEETIRLLSRAVELDPGYYPSYKARALAYYALRDYTSMLQEIQVIIALRPEDPLGYTLRAIVQREAGQFEAAIQDHNRAINVCDMESELAELHNQRRETFVCMGNLKAALRDAQISTELKPEQFMYRFHVFATLISLHQYEAAIQEYEGIMSAGLAHQQQFEAWAKRHLFDILGNRGSFEPPVSIIDSEAFSAMQEASDFYTTLATKATRLVNGVYGQSSWSPDGKQLAYGRSDWYMWEPQTLTTGAPTISGPSGIEILDLESGTTRLLVSFGKDPVWSPDGEYIAFVSEQERLHGSKEELWIIPAAGGEPRRLVPGACPVWSRDSNQIFFHSRLDRTICSIHAHDPAAEPELILSCLGWDPQISPDGQYVAYAVGNELSIVELSSGEVKTKWITPGPQTGRSMEVNWSPDCKELSLGAWSDLGLWIFDVDRQEGRQVVEAPARSCVWSPDRSQVIIEIGPPFEEIWLVTLDPSVSTYQALAPALTPEEFLLLRQAEYARAIEAHPENAREYLSKLTLMAAQNYRSGAYEQALETLNRVDELHRTVSNDESHPRDLALMVVVLRALGRDQEAQAFLTQLHHLWETRGYTRADFTFGTPILVPNVSSEYDEAAPHISSDGLSLYFCGWLNNRPGGYGKADIWVSTRATKDDDWGPPVNLKPPVNSSSMDGSPCISANGLELFFASRRPGGYGDIDLYVARRAHVSAPWEEPENLGPAFNSLAWDGAPNLSADNLSLYFCSEKDGQYPGGDIFVTTRPNLSAPWSQPTNLGASINTQAYGEWASSISPDGLILFFCGGSTFRPDGYGGGDIWVATRPTISDLWLEPINLGESINTPAREAGVSVSADGSTIYFHSDRPGGPGVWNIWETPILQWSTDIEIDSDMDLAERLVERYFGKEVISGKNE